MGVDIYAGPYPMVLPVLLSIDADAALLRYHVTFAEFCCGL